MCFSSLNHQIPFHFTTETTDFYPINYLAKEKYRAAEKSKNGLPATIVIVPIFCCCFVQGKFQTWVCFAGGDWGLEHYQNQFDKKSTENLMIDKGKHD